MGDETPSLLLSHSVTTVLLLNHRIIGSSNPSVSFQVRKQGCHVVHFLCSLSMSSSLFVKDTTIHQVLWEPRVWEGFFVLHDKENRYDKHVKAVYIDEERLPERRTTSLHWTPGTRDCWDLMCCFFTKYDGQIIGEVIGRQVQWQSVRKTAHVRKCCILANKKLPNEKIEILLPKWTLSDLTLLRL